MTDPNDRPRIAAWVAQLKGTRTGDEFAADIAATIGWTVDRTQVGRYVKGSIPIGRKTIDRFSEYAAAKGLPALDLAPPEPELTLELRAVLAAERQAIALERIANFLTPEQGHADLSAMLQAFAAQQAATQLPLPSNHTPSAGR
jgi:hypothetical protein